MNYLNEITGKNIYAILNHQFLGQIRFFISGVILLFYFDWLKKNQKWILPMAIIIFIARFYIPSQLTDFLYPFAFAVIIISFAYMFSSLKAASRFGDFSYGFYLFHFPVIQTIIHFGWLKNSPILLFCLCFGITLSLSCLSWHLLERKFLKR